MDTDLDMKIHTHIYIYTHYFTHCSALWIVNSVHPRMCFFMIWNSGRLRLTTISLDALKFDVYIFICCWVGVAGVSLGWFSGVAVISTPFLGFEKDKTWKFMWKYLFVFIFHAKWYVSPLTRCMAFHEKHENTNSWWCWWQVEKTCYVKTCVIGHGKVLIGHGNRVKNVNGIFGIFMHENCENAKMRKCEKTWK